MPLPPSILDEPSLGGTTDRGALDPRRDGILAALLVGLACALDTSTFREVLIGDGPQLLSHYQNRGWSAVWMHVLYLPAANLLRILSFTGPLESLRLLSTLAGASVAGSTFLLARALGLGRAAASWAAVTVCLTPAVWFQATTGEVHALQVAVVTGAALVTVMLPWQRPAAATAGAACMLALCYLAHMSSLLLGPGWVLLCQLGRCRVARPFSVRELVLRVGLPLLGGLFLAMGGTDWIRGLTGSAMRTDGIGMFLQKHRRAGGIPTSEFLRMLGPLPLAAAAALAVGRAGGWKAAAMCLLALPHVAWAVWFGQHEHGGYLVVPVPFLALLAAQAFSRNRAMTLALLGTTIVTGWFGYVAVVESAAAVDLSPRADRTLLVEEALPEGGVLVSFDAARQTVQAAVNNVREVNLQSELHSALRLDRTPEQFVERILPGLRQVLAENPGRVVLDVSYRPELEQVPALAPYFVEFERRLRPFLGRGLERGVWRIEFLNLPDTEPER